VELNVCTSTEPGGAAEAQVVPLEVKTFPELPGATACRALVPLPNNTLLAVNVAAPVPPLATGSVPVTPVVRGRPVALVKTPEAGVPKAGVTSVGLVRVVLVSVAPDESALVAIAVEMASNSSSSSVPLTRFKGSPVVKLSLVS
jgi:hypothetical protein